MFDSDLQFCPECGTIFPLPVDDNDVKCMNQSCGFQVPATGQNFHLLSFY